MNTFPPELLDYICRIACLDEGDTIRTLNRVSRYFNEVSRPYLYHTVSAVGLKQIGALLDRLGSTPARLRRVHHLFLSGTSTSSSDTSARDRFAPEECNNTITRVVTLAAPTLRSFSFFAGSPFSSTTLIGRIFRTSFPHLHTLAVSGFYPFPSVPGNFPALTHLHLNGNRNPLGLLQVASLENACPALTDLKVSGLNGAALFVLELSVALKGYTIAGKEGNIMMPPRIPSRLRRLTIQAGPEPTPSSSIVKLKDSAMILRMELLALERPSHQNIELLVLERNQEVTSCEELRKDWLAGLTTA